jgi:thymidine phosphorylase
LLNDLELDNEAFERHIIDTASDKAIEIVNRLSDNLSALNNKTRDRRRKIDQASKNIREGKDVAKWKAFIEKAGRKEEGYPRERRLVIERQIMLEYVEMAHGVIKELLGNSVTEASSNSDAGIAKD